MPFASAASTRRSDSSTDTPMIGNNGAGIRRGELQALCPIAWLTMLMSDRMDLRT